jgi:hypothetical protein
MMEWKPIESAPRDGTPILGLQWGRYSYERNVSICWWQREFEAFISSCRQMDLANGHTFDDGTTSRLHSPVIEPIDFWQPFAPPTGEKI